MSVINLSPSEDYRLAIEQHGLRVIPVDSDVRFLGGFNRWSQRSRLGVILAVL